MLAVIACVSSQGVWILCDPKATRVLAQVCWNDSESSDLAASTGPKLDELLKRHLPEVNDPLRQIEKLFVLSGPGAFTGLRVTASFALGLSRALQIPIAPLPTFDLLSRPFQIPLQHQRHKHVSLAQLEKDGEDVLLVEAAKAASLQKATTSIEGRGFLESPLWPSPEELLLATRKNLVSKNSVEVFYGLNPKISGQRI